MSFGETSVYKNREFSGKVCYYCELVLVYILIDVYSHHYAEYLGSAFCFVEYINIGRTVAKSLNHDKGMFLGMSGGWL